MADLILKVTPEEVRTKANEIKTQKSLLEDYMQDMRNKVTELGGYWQAASGENYAEKYQSVSNSVQGALERIQQHIDNLIAAADRYDELETSQVQAVNTLEANNIF